MDQTIFAIAMPLALMAIGMFAIWMAHRGKIASLGAERLNADNRALEERMRNLERIITDRGYDVATQIEALRDPRPSVGTFAEKRGERVD